MAELRGRLDVARLLVDDEARLSSNAADYVVIRRQVPAAKGKWQRVSKEVEDVHDEG